MSKKSKKKIVRYRLRENQPDLYNKTYSLDEDTITGGDNGYDGHIKDSKRIKINKDDLANLIIFAVEQGILTEQKKQKRQQYNKLKLAPQHFPKNKRLDAELFESSGGLRVNLVRASESTAQGNRIAKQS